MKQAIILTLLLAGCAHVPEPYYAWFPVGKPLDKVVWEQRPMFGPDGINHACVYAPVRPLPTRTLFAGCAVRLMNNGQPYCLVLSTLSEQQAKATLTHDGLTHYEHEAEWHCKRGLNHWGKM